MDNIKNIILSKNDEELQAIENAITEKVEETIIDVDNLPYRDLVVKYKEL
jgi:hypothetical protein